MYVKALTLCLWTQPRGKAPVNYGFYPWSTFKLSFNKASLLTLPNKLLRMLRKAISSQSESLVNYTINCEILI